MTIHAYTTTETKVDEYQLRNFVDERVNEKLQPLLEAIETLKAAVDAKVERGEIRASLEGADRARTYVDKDGDTWQYGLPSDDADEAGWYYEGSWTIYAERDTRWAGPFTQRLYTGPKAGDLFDEVKDIPVGTRFGIARDGKRANDLGVWIQFAEGGKFFYKHGLDAVPTPGEFSHWTAVDVQRYAPFIVL